MIGEILTGMNILEKLGKFLNWVRGRKSPPAETIVTRFVRLVENHGVHRNQIPRFIGHGLSLKDVQDDVSLLAKLDEPLFESVCKLFAVRREWLDGAEKQIHPEHDFYKHPERFAEFLDELIAANPEGDFHGVLLAPEERDGHVEALLIVQETIGHVGDKPIFRFHLCNNWSFTYWKARACLTACIAIAWKRKVFVNGVTMPKKEIDPLAYGETLLGWNGEGAWFMGRRKWYPEDMALKPEVFLDGIDPERDDFGVKSGLKLWLDLEMKGLMDIGQRSVICENPRQAFQLELEKY
ncbi:MAG TPA: hypothetical protein VMV48_07820 [Gallionellaceae bacterium]|nr:hypothetical protein [Gallionellaceae bacterium]